MELCFQRKVCYSCGIFVKKSAMWGKKMVEFDEVANVATVYHIGNHLCDLKLQKDEYDWDIIDDFEGLEHLGPCHLQT